MNDWLKKKIKETETELQKEADCVGPPGARRVLRRVLHHRRHHAPRRELEAAESGLTLEIGQRHVRHVTARCSRVDMGVALGRGIRRRGRVNGERELALCCDLGQGTT